MTTEEKLNKLLNTLIDHSYDWGELRIGRTQAIEQSLNPYRPSKRRAVATRVQAVKDKIVLLFEEESK